MSVNYRIDGQVAIIKIGEEREAFISFTKDRLKTLRTILEELLSKKVTSLLFLPARGDMTCVGADVRAISEVKTVGEAAALVEFGQQTFDLVEQFPRSVMAISGPCVGGGCELALACKHRIISTHKTSAIGLPETKLGIFPGWGGTQRLPRKIGISAALDIILKGKTLRPNEAFAVGLVDKITTVDELERIGMQIARGEMLIGTRPRGFLENLLTYTGVGRFLVKRQVAKQLGNGEARFYPALQKAVDSVLHGLSNGMVAGLQFEKEQVAKLLFSDECRGLLHLYFLIERSKDLGKALKGQLDGLSFAVYGSGVMGSGIASLIAQSDYKVCLIDQDEKILDKALFKIKNSIQKNRKLSETEKSQAVSNITATKISDAKPEQFDVIIEAIYENKDAKEILFKSIAPKINAGTLVATNTSALSVTRLAESMPPQERFLGMHFFNPADRMPLLEVIIGEKTGAKALNYACALASRFGKHPIVVQDQPGFLVNRVLTPYLCEVAHLLHDGYAPEEIDKAAIAFGMPVGPVALLDQIGLDVAASVLQTMLTAYGSRMSCPDYCAQLAAQGFKGRKSGAGFYIYNDDGKTILNPKLGSILKTTQPTIKADSQAEIQDRLILVMVNEALRCLHEGIAGVVGPEAMGQIDLGMIMGIGFPPFRGGILYYAEKRGHKAIAARLSELQRITGSDRFKPCEALA